MSLVWFYITCLSEFSSLKGRFRLLWTKLFLFHESAKKEEDIEEESLKLEPTIRDPRLRQQSQSSEWKEKSKWAVKLKEIEIYSKQKWSLFIFRTLRCAGLISNHNSVKRNVNVRMKIRKRNSNRTTAIDIIIMVTIMITIFISFIIFSTFKVQEVNVNEACIR